MNFETRLAELNVSIHNGNYKNTYDLEGAFIVCWDYYTEMRDWGVKEIGVYATRVSGVVYKSDEDILESERQEIDSDDKGWELKSDTSDIEFGQCIQPYDIYVDIENKEIIVNF
tara:strand:+ start:367 stop:708 length:342 start_codon:yes stop_codon:yes gene_type:complete